MNLRKLRCSMKLASCLALCLLLVVLGCKPPGPTSVAGDALADEGIDLYRAREFEPAAAKLNKRLGASTSRHSKAELHGVLGNCYTELDRYDEGIAQQQKALALDPTLHEAWVNMGVAQRLKGEFDEAERCYREAEKLNPNYAELHASFGAVYILKDEPQKALASLDRAISLDKTLAIAHSNRALALATLGRHDDADAAPARLSPSATTIARS